MAARIPPTVLRAALACAREKFLDGGHFGVVGVGVGRRRLGRRWRQEAVITIFVERKCAQDGLAEQALLPASLAVHYRRREYLVPIDVVELGAAPGEAQGLVALGSQVALAAGLAGTLAWFQTVGQVDYAVTAEHVVGFDYRGPVRLHPQGQLLGQVVASAYGRRRLDAALIRLAEDWNYARVLPFNNGVPGEPRLPTDSDTYPLRSGPAAWVWLPSSQRLAPVRIRHLHVAGLAFRQPDGRTFEPASLILTDPCTSAGESGTLLLGADRAPLGLLTGLRRDPRGGAPLYSCFTELVPALFALLG